MGNRMEARAQAEARDFSFERRYVFYTNPSKKRDICKEIFEKRPPFGIKISQESLSFHHQILSIPFYLTSHLPRLIDSLG